MMNDYVELTETIAFDGHGGSHHVWTLPSGTIWREETFEISPVLMRPAGSWVYGEVPFDVARIVRKVRTPIEVLE